MVVCTCLLPEVAVVGAAARGLALCGRRGVLRMHSCAAKGTERLPGTDGCVVGCSHEASPPLTTQPGHQRARDTDRFIERSLSITKHASQDCSPKTLAATSLKMAKIAHFLCLGRAP